MSYAYAYGKFNWLLYSGVFYYILGNIRPVFRSNLQNIQLVAIAKSADIKKYGCDVLLQPFIDQINALGKVMITYVAMHVFISLSTKIYN